MQNTKLNFKKRGFCEENLVVHSDVDLHLSINDVGDVLPVLLQRRDPVGRHRHLAELNLVIGHLVGLQRLEEGARRQL